jgi:hypothetical protein
MSDDLKTAELESMKTKADLLGVKYHPAIGADALREKIKAHEAAADQAAAAAEANTGPGPVMGSTPPAPAAVVVSAVEAQRARLRNLRDEATKLVRIRLSCLNPAKKEWSGEIITAGNSVLGSFKKFVPFSGADEGYHVPFIIYQVLKDRQCPLFYTEKSKNGVNMRKSKMIREFAIEILDQLTPDELHDLAQRQAMAKSID